MQMKFYTYQTVVMSLAFWCLVFYGYACSTEDALQAVASDKAHLNISTLPR